MNLSGYDEIVVLRRGFQGMLEEDSGPNKKNRENLLTSPDMIDNSDSVNKLTAIIRNEQETYFLLIQQTNDIVCDFVHCLKL